MAAWWTPFALATVFVPGWLFGAVAFARSTEWVVRAGPVVGVVFSVPVLAWPFAWEGTVPEGTFTWISSLPALAGLAVAAGCRARWALIYTVAMVTVTQWINHRMGIAPIPLLPDVLMNAGWCAIVVAAAGRAIRTGALLDATWAEQLDSAAERARAHEWGRVRDWIHDRVLATLLTASRFEHSRELRRTAAEVLAQLRFLESGAPGTVADVAGPVAVDRLSAAARRESDSVVLAISTDGEVDSITFPADAVMAMETALAQAVHNSVRHGGAAARREVTVTIFGSGLGAVIVDDGAGFDLGGVPAGRLGVTSIQTRMRRVVGGSATISSQPGQGTTVVLEWVRPRARPVEPDDVRTLIGMRSPLAWVFTAAYLVGVVSVGIVSRGTIEPLWPLITALVIAAGATIGLLVVRADPLPFGTTVLVAMTSPMACVLVLWVVPVPLESGSQTWPLFASAPILSFLCIRGRLGYAWSAIVMVNAVFGCWAAVTGQGVLAGIAMSSVWVAPVAMATVLALTIRPTARKIFDLREAENARAALEATRLEREARLRLLDDEVRAMLRRIATDSVLSHQERSAAGVLEARVRSVLRGRLLVGPRLDAAVGAARGRQVEVVLMDDGGLDTSAREVRDRLIEAIATELDRAGDGRVSIRIAPPHSDHLATVVANAISEVRRSTFDHNGERVTPRYGFES